MSSTTSLAVYGPPRRPSFGVSAGLERGHAGGEQSFRVSATHAGDVGPSICMDRFRRRRFARPPLELFVWLSRSRLRSSACFAGTDTRNEVWCSKRAQRAACGAKKTRASATVRVLKGRITVGAGDRVPRECSGEANAACFPDGFGAWLEKTTAERATIAQHAKMGLKRESLTVVLEASDRLAITFREGSTWHKQ